MKIKLLVLFLALCSASKIMAQNLEKHIFYAPEEKIFTGLVFLNPEYKLLSNMENVLLMGSENTLLDTMSVRTKLLKPDEIFSIIVLDSLNFNLVCQNTSYLISIKNKQFDVIKKVDYSDRKKYNSFSYLYLTKNKEVTVNYKYKRKENTVNFAVYDESNNLLHTMNLSYKGIFNQYTNVIYSFPQTYYYYQNTLIYSNTFDNTISFINLIKGEIKQLELLPYDLNSGSQTVFFDHSNKTYYMLRDTGTGEAGLHNYELFDYDVSKNSFSKLKEFSYFQSQFRGGIYNSKFIMTGSFNNESAWFTIPIREINQYSGHLKLQIND